MNDKNDYPEEVCAYCEYTDWGTQPYPFHGPNGTECEGAYCEAAAEEYKNQTGKDWEW